MTDVRDSEAAAVGYTLGLNQARLMRVLGYVANFPPLTPRELADELARVSGRPPGTRKPAKEADHVAGMLRTLQRRRLVERAGYGPYSARTWRLTALGLRVYKELPSCR